MLKSNDFLKSECTCNVEMQFLLRSAGPSLGISINRCHLLKVSKFHRCQATVNQKFLKNSHVPLHRNSKYHGCQETVAPILKRALLMIQYCAQKL